VPGEAIATRTRRNQAGQPDACSAPIQHEIMTDLTAQLAIARGRSPWPAFSRSGADLVGRGGLLAGGVWLAVVALAEPFGRSWRTGQEAFCYWIANLNSPYSLSDWGSPIAYVYSPAFLQAVSH
jgi:hypothetical protein